jgi:uncharacterized membrane protein SpoIIM required for sporulation
MDIDRFIARNEPTWQRLGELVALGRRGVRRLGPAGVDELVMLYQRTSAHLSFARTSYSDRALVSRLTTLVAAASGVVYGRRSRSLRAFARFWALVFPGAVWHCRRTIAASAALFAGTWFVVAVWVGTSGTALEASAPAAARQAYVSEDFEAYYSSGPAGEFATRITINNIMVGFIAFAGGILLGVGTIVSMASQGYQFGQVNGWFIAVGENGYFWGLVAPHGLLELTAIMIAGGAGFRLGWAIVDPGDRTRSEALAEEGRRSVVVILGCTAMFVVAAMIEAYVTPSGLPTAVRILVGASVWVAFGLYVVSQGRRAAAQGITGLLAEAPRRWDAEPALAHVAVGDDAALQLALDSGHVPPVRGARWP